jgi:hypothetical protein
MGVHRVGRHEEPFGDLAIGEAVGRELSTVEAKGPPGILAVSSRSSRCRPAWDFAGALEAGRTSADDRRAVGGEQRLVGGACRVRAEAMSGSSVRSGSQPDQHDI